MLKNRSVLLFKAEVTYNIDPVPTGAANAVLVENLDWKLSHARLYQRNPVRTTFGKVKPLWAGSLIDITFDVEIKGSGAAGTAPEFGPMLRACGFAETVVGATSVTYKPASATIASGTFYLHRDGKRLIVTGCRGTVKGMVGVGEAGKLSFAFTGHCVAETDAALPTPTYLATLPVPVIGAAFSADSYSGIFTKIDWDAGVALAFPDNINATDGFGEIQVVDRNVQGSLDIEDVLVATYDFFLKWKGGNAFSITTGTIGGTAGNRFALSFPAATWADFSPGVKADNILTRETKFDAAETVAGDDDLSLILT